MFRRKEKRFDEWLSTRGSISEQSILPHGSLCQSLYQYRTVLRDSSLRRGLACRPRIRQVAPTFISQTVLAILGLRPSIQILECFCQLPCIVVRIFSRDNLVFFFLNYNIIKREASVDFAELSEHTLRTKTLQVACWGTDREGCILGKTKHRNGWFQQGAARMEPWGIKMCGAVWGSGDTGIRWVDLSILLFRRHAGT